MACLFPWTHLCACWQWEESRGVGMALSPPTQSFPKQISCLSLEKHACCSVSVAGDTSDEVLRMTELATTKIKVDGKRMGRLGERTEEKGTNDTATAL